MKTKHIIAASTIGFFFPFLFLILRLITGEFLEPLDISIADNALRRTPSPKNKDIVIVEIDENTKRHLGEVIHYPQLWFKDFLKKCKNPKAVCICFPLHFPKEIPISAIQSYDTIAKITGISSQRLRVVIPTLEYIKEDEELKKLIEKNNVYFGFEIKKEKYGEEILIFDVPIWKIPKKLKTTVFSGKDFIAPSKNYLSKARGAGFINLLPDEDGITRRIPLIGLIRKDTVWKIKKDSLGRLDHFYLSLPLAVMAGIKKIKNIEIPDMYHIKLDKYLLPVEPPNTAYRPLFHYREKSFKKYSMWGIISSSTPKNFKNKIIIVGREDEKTYPTPLSNSMPVHLIHANTIASLIKMKPLIKSSPFVEFILSILLSFIVASVFFFKYRRYLIPSVLILWGIFYLICISLIKSGYWLSFFHPFFTSLLSFIVAGIFWVFDEGKNIPILLLFSKRHKGKIDNNFIRELSYVPYVKTKDYVFLSMFFNAKKKKKSLKDVAVYIDELEEIFKETAIRYGGMIVPSEDSLFTAVFEGDRAVMNACAAATELRKKLRDTNARCMADEIGEILFGLGVSKGVSSFFKIKPFPDPQFIITGKPIALSKELAILAVEQKKEILIDQEIAKGLPKGSLREEIGELSFLDIKTPVYELLKIK